MNHDYCERVEAVPLFNYLLFFCRLRTSQDVLYSRHSVSTLLLLLLQWQMSPIRGDDVDMVLTVLAEEKANGQRNFNSEGFSPSLISSPRKLSLKIHQENIDTNIVPSLGQLNPPVKPAEETQHSIKRKSNDVVNDRLAIPVDHEIDNEYEAVSSSSILHLFPTLSTEAGEQNSIDSTISAATGTRLIPTTSAAYNTKFFEFEALHHLVHDGRSKRQINTSHRGSTFLYTPVSLRQEQPPMPTVLVLPRTAHRSIKTVI